MRTTFVVRVGEPVGPRTRLGDDRALLEREDGLGRSHEGEERLDGLPALGVGDRVLVALDGLELELLGSGQPREERSRPGRCRAQLEMRRAAERERPAPRNAPRSTRRDSSYSRRRGVAPIERRMPSIDDPGRVEDAEGVLVTLQVELIARRGVERAASIRSDFRAKAASRRSANPRRADTPLPRSRWSDQPPARAAQAPGGVEQRGELGEPVALALRGDRGELLADVLRRDHSPTPSSASTAA